MRGKKKSKKEKELVCPSCGSESTKGLSVGIWVRNKYKTKFTGYG